MACEVGTRIKRKAGQARGGRGGEGTRRGEGAERRGAGGPGFFSKRTGHHRAQGPKTFPFLLKLEGKKKKLWECFDIEY